MITTKKLLSYEFKNIADNLIVSNNILKLENEFLFYSGVENRTWKSVSDFIKLSNTRRSCKFTNLNSVKTFQNNTTELNVSIVLVFSKDICYKIKIVDLNS